MNGFADREPVLPPIYLADTVAGLTGAFSVMAALREVEVNGGHSQVIDLPLLDPLFTALGPQAANYRLTGQVKDRTGSRSTTSAPSYVYRTSDDGWVCLSASTQATAEWVLRSIGRPELVEDPRFSTNEQQVANGVALDAISGAFVARRTLDENVALFEAAEVTVGPVNDIVRLRGDRHVRSRALLADYPDDDMGAFNARHVVALLGGTWDNPRTGATTQAAHARDTGRGRSR